MQVGQESVSVPEGDIGLGRAAINQHGQINLVNQDLPTSLPPPGVAVPSHHQSSHPNRGIRSSFDERRHDTAIKLRKVLHISKESDFKDDFTSPILANSTTEVSGSRLVHDLPVPDKRTMKEMIHNPVDTVKDKISGQGSHHAAANIAAKEISHGQEVDLVHAHDRLQHAETDSEKLLAVNDLDRLLRERQTMYVRWTVDRHVAKCRVLPRETFVQKSLSAFQSKNLQGQTVTDWRAYATHVSISILCSLKS